MSRISQELGSAASGRNLKGFALYICRIILLLVFCSVNTFAYAKAVCKCTQHPVAEMAGSDHHCDQAVENAQQSGELAGPESRAHCSGICGCHLLVSPCLLAGKTFRQHLLTAVTSKSSSFYLALIASAQLEDLRRPPKKHEV